MQLHFNQAIKQVQKGNYYQAERWLNRVQHSSDSQASVKKAMQPLSV
ncbi:MULTISPECIES: hypothetical protein [unclassified Coleofasciculus]|nr:MULTISPECIES: hypothetical protein [unclassified Coleofasciculus]MBD1896608.1 hypothetical protein [Coleofasciculus sp. FACHB-129]MBD2086537.1 hypothetical protein [Coleofasciculus sp. FACHB-542]